jgi:hypothetical protein
LTSCAVLVLEQLAQQALTWTTSLIRPARVTLRLWMRRRWGRQRKQGHRCFVGELAAAAGW